MIIIIILVVILIVLIGIAIFLYFFKNKILNSCDDTNKCLDFNNICIDIPQYYIKNSENVCMLDCSDDDVCIQANRCILTPRNFIKNYEDNKCKKVTSEDTESELMRIKTTLIPTTTPIITETPTPTIPASTME